MARAHESGNPELQIWEGDESPSQISVTMHAPQELPGERQDRHGVAGRDGFLQQQHAARTINILDSGVSYVCRCEHAI